MIKQLRVFGRTKDLEQQIDDFLNKISESALLFKLAVKAYLKQGHNDEFRQMLDNVTAMESEADHLRRGIERELYLRTLIPDSRGDVLGLIETLDHVLTLFEGALWSFENERPDIPAEFSAGYKKLTSLSVKSVESLVLAARAFFHSPHAVGDYNHKVMFYEREADKSGTALKRDIFASDLDLARKIHLREFAEHIDNVADWAEDVADRLAIYAIKRIV